MEYLTAVYIIKMAPSALSSEVEKRVIQLCEEFKQGINYQIIQNDMPELKQEQVVDVINKLLANSRIDMLKKDDGALVFKLRDPGSLHRIKGAEPEEQAPKKKTYLLYDLEPDRSLTGGAWYSDQHFDSEFVDILNQQCWRFLEQRMVRARQVAGGPIAVRNASYISSKEVLKHINELGITKLIKQCDDVGDVTPTKCRYMKEWLKLEW
ncbi:DNA-directed RNA polymerase III subunit RPC6 [Portunus trituberculatus]|uniref:DNA-directed RNA polymerase III subunit RPC6 n=1 Tax=Portunus trituberculatus TaxID=210409 RepID=A0A5B7DQX3_PORTR|nr:DNA-directed RNA polymerase III subunit RPC6 [Portunus trituberculatus]